MKMKSEIKSTNYKLVSQPSPNTAASAFYFYTSKKCYPKTLDYLIWKITQNIVPKPDVYHGVKLSTWL